MSKNKKKIYKQIENYRNNKIKNDMEKINFWKNYFYNKKETKKFIEKSLDKDCTRRMMLRVKWYVEIADAMPKIKSKCQALQMVFLVAMAEGVANKKYIKEFIKEKNKKGVKECERLNSKGLIKDFFKHINKEDKQNLRFERTSLRREKLEFKEIIDVLCQSRHDAVHGEGFHIFSLYSDEKNITFDDDPSFCLGFEGGRYNKKMISLKIANTYEEVRDIFVRTAIENIKSKF